MKTHIESVQINNMRYIVCCILSELRDSIQKRTRSSLIKLEFTCSFNCKEDKLFSKKRMWLCSLRERSSLLGRLFESYEKKVLLKVDPSFFIQDNCALVRVKIYDPSLRNSLDQILKRYSKKVAFHIT